MDSVRRDNDNITGNLKPEQVTAADFGSPRLSSSGTVVVAVDDENDNAPSFESDFYAFEVEENSDEGTVVGLALAFDKDDGENARIR